MGKAKPIASTTRVHDWHAHLEHSRNDWIDPKDAKKKKMI